MPDGVLRVDHEAVSALAKEVADLRSALEEVAAFARADLPPPRRFGPLGEAAGAAFGTLHEALLTSFEKVVPQVDGMVAELVESTKRIADVDEEAARRITRAGER
ncbi:hypothetical protein V5P93_006771 [Actinokineospora auranticolor]|uniref:Excreted virulence factor EspC (Type VII ESX diderm) n=1 Tax=Actinokineospora auranticolor TaxID=155976 RepID=A0A2S6GWI7_9PSEU|nr:hypothetical protein [Actinokineospora auranticolor]PPK69584.1 hypothetical protein CLV40_103194 [Actinokineospora auranticolor]